MTLMKHITWKIDHTHAILMNHVKKSNQHTKLIIYI